MTLRYGFDAIPILAKIKHEGFEISWEFATREKSARLIRSCESETKR